MALSHRSEGEGKEYPGELARASINYVKRSMITYLDGKKNLNWILGVIRSSGLPRDIFSSTRVKLTG